MVVVVFIIAMELYVDRTVCATIKGLGWSRISSDVELLQRCLNLDYISGSDVIAVVSLKRSELITSTMIRFHCIGEADLSYTVPILWCKYRAHEFVFAFRIRAYSAKCLGITQLSPSSGRSRSPPRSLALAFIIIPTSLWCWWWLSVTRKPYRIRCWRFTANWFWIFELTIESDVALYLWFSQLSSRVSSLRYKNL